jgi:hypothetical protein
MIVETPTALYLTPPVPRYQIHTHQNTNTTAAMNRSQERQLTPVPRLAMRNIFFMVPARRSRVPSKRSFIVSISVLLLRTSSPMATVIYFGASSQCQFILGWGREGERGGTYILQHPHLGTQPLHRLVILCLQLLEYRSRVLSLPIRRRRSILPPTYTPNPTSTCAYP